MSLEFSADEFEHLKNVLPLYESAQQIFLEKLHNLNSSLDNSANSAPIEHIKARLKTPASIAQKLHRLGLDLTAFNARYHLKDVSGIRIICPFFNDVYDLVDVLCTVPDWKVSEKEDYIIEPKPSGYRSYHMIIDLPVCSSGTIEEIPIELQIRTAAMDFWATMEHKVRYKYKEHVPKHLSDELALCADKIMDLDKRMLLVHEIISLVNQKTV